MKSLPNSPDITKSPAAARLLVVDDEAVLVTALRDTLVRQGFEVVGITSPTAALERLGRERFDLLLTDLEMPGMDGIAFFKAALAIDCQLIPIVMTGHGTIDTAVEAMKSGAFDYILKPFKLSVVVPALSRALAMRRLRLENEALQESLKRRTGELEAANKDLEAFSYSVSHDLRAPLRTISGFSSMLDAELESQKTESIAKYIGSILSGVERMNTLIDDLLRLARTARAEIRCVPVSLTKIAEEIAGKLRVEAGERAVEWKIAPDLLANGDPGLLRVVMENLLSNAWKYTGKVAHACIEVGEESHPAEGRTVFYVRDNGAGFNMKYADRLFAPFQRLHSQNDFPGNGVGLATVQRIIRKHGGGIWVEAAEGQGATIRFTLS